MGKSKQVIDSTPWDTIINDLSSIDKKETKDFYCDLLYFKYGKSKPDFYEVFREQSRKISLNERSIYYNSTNLSQDKIDEIERLPVFSVINSDLGNIDYMYQLSLIYDLQNWSSENNNSLSLTKVWFYSLERDFPVDKWEIKDRLFLLMVVIRFKIIEANEGSETMSSGGERVSKLLSIILNEPSATIETHLPDMEAYMDFNKLNKAIQKENQKGLAGKWFKKLTSLEKVIDNLTLSNKISKKNKDLLEKLKRCKEYFEGIENAYNEYFGQ